MKKRSSIALIFICFIFLNGCGKDNGNSSGFEANQTEQSTRTSEYRVVFSSLNTNIGNHKSFGTAILRFEEEIEDGIIENEFEVLVNTVNLPSNVTHRQVIHQGSNCPTLSQDSNGDGFLSFEEAHPTTGANLMYLDGDLSSQDPEGSIFPSGSSYSYEKETDYENLPSGFNLQDKILVLYGVSSAPLGLDPKNTPIACGKITPVASF